MAAVVLVSALARSVPFLARLTDDAREPRVFTCEARLAPSRLAAVLDRMLASNVAAFTPTLEAGRDPTGICDWPAAIRHRLRTFESRRFTIDRTRRVEVDGSPICEATRLDCVEVYRFRADPFFLSKIRSVMTRLPTPFAVRRSRLLSVVGSTRRIQMVRRSLGGMGRSRRLSPRRRPWSFRATWTRTAKGSGDTLRYTVSIANAPASTTP